MLRQRTSTLRNLELRLLSLFLICDIAVWAVSVNIRDFKFNNGLVVLPGIFSPSEFMIVQRISKELCKKSLKKEINSLAKGRFGCRIDRKSELHEMFSHSRILSRIKRATGREKSNLVIPPDFPLEIRKYGIGAHMPFHFDEQLYKHPQLELVFTIENTSDSYTCWIDSTGATQKLRTEPNSLLCIQATTVKHAVTPLKKGERVILKGLLVAEGEEILDVNSFEKALQTYS